MENEKGYTNSYTSHPMRNFMVPTTYDQQKSYGSKNYNYDRHTKGHSSYGPKSYGSTSYVPKSYGSTSYRSMNYDTTTYEPPSYSPVSYSPVSHSPMSYSSMSHGPPSYYVPALTNTSSTYADVTESEPVKTKKIRVKLICVFPKWKYLCAKTTVEDYHSLFGGVLDNISGKNHFASILNCLEKEFNEETSGSVHLNFQKRKFTYRNGSPLVQELSFVYIGTFHEFDTIFTLIYIPKITPEIIMTWNFEIKKAQENLVRSIFKDVDIHIDQILLINRIFHQKLMRIPCPNYNISRPLFQFICSKLKEYHGFLEKTGVTIMNEDQFFDEHFVWEWNTMDPKLVQTKIHDLFLKTGVQVQE